MESWQNKSPQSVVIDVFTFNLATVQYVVSRIILIPDSTSVLCAHVEMAVDKCNEIVSHLPQKPYDLFHMPVFNYNK